MNVFISHSFEDHSYAVALANALHAYGVDSSFAFALEPGTDVEKAIRGSDAAIFLVSPQSIEHANLYFDLGAVIGLNKPLVTVIAQEMKGKSLPMPLMANRSITQRSPEQTAKIITEILTMQEQEKHPFKRAI
jgi:hypothetical protein